VGEGQVLEFSWNDKLDLKLYRSRHGLSFKEPVINLERNEKTRLNTLSSNFAGTLTWTARTTAADLTLQGRSTRRQRMGTRHIGNCMGGEQGNPAVRWLAAPVQRLLMYFYRTST
jgi:hypothetical protein